MKGLSREEVVGKTIKMTYMGYDNNFLIRFTDDTILKIKSIRGYYDEADLDIDKHIDERDLLNIEMITEEEYDKMCDERHKIWQAQQKEIDLRKLAELKAKYEK